MFNSDINPAIAVSAALAAPSKILTTNADFISGINAKNIPSAPFLKNIFFLESFVNMQLALFLPPVISGKFTQELKIFFKNGAEGVFLALIPEIKSALVVKILDGAARAAETAIAGLISELNIIDENKLEKLKSSEVINSTGQKIGKLRFVL